MWVGAQEEEEREEPHTRLNLMIEIMTLAETKNQILNGVTRHPQHNYFQTDLPLFSTSFYKLASRNSTTPLSQLKKGGNN